MYKIYICFLIFVFFKWLARKDNQEVGSCLSVPDRNETEFVSYRIRKNRVPMQNCFAVGDIKAQNNRYTGKKIKSQNMLKYNSHVICQSWKILRHLPIIVFLSFWLLKTLFLFNKLLWRQRHLSTRHLQFATKSKRFCTKPSWKVYCHNVKRTLRVLCKPCKNLFMGWPEVL